MFYLDSQEKAIYSKAMKKAKSLIAAAKRERDRKGYRENLGYDSRRKLDDFLAALDLSYIAASSVLDYFDNECHAI